MKVTIELDDVETEEEKKLAARLEEMQSAPESESNIEFEERISEDHQQTIRKLTITFLSAEPIKEVAGTH